MDEQLYLTKLSKDAADYEVRYILEYFDDKIVVSHRSSVS